MTTAGATIKNLRKKGLTLIEAVICIGILVVLVALILPAFKSSSEASQSVHCTGNLRQLAAAFNVYAGDHGRYPQIYRIGSSGHWYYNQKLLAVMNMPEADVWAGRTKILLCPSDKTGNQQISADGATRFLSYGANLVLGSGESDAEGSIYRQGINPSRLQQPSKLGILCDSNNFFFNPVDEGASAISFRHRGGLNMAFADGHVEWRKDISSDPWLFWPDGVPY